MEANSLVAKFTRDHLLVDLDSVQYFTALLTELSEMDDFHMALERSELRMAGQTDEEFFADDWARPYEVSNGTLVIPVKGALLNKFGYQLGRFATGYQYIERAVSRGMSDPEVQRIALDIDSPGGLVAGNFELVEKIAGDDRKPVIAFANSAYSAAYSIASAADTIYVARSGGVGSIGVLATHVSFEGMLDKEGIKVTHIYAGKHKVDGTPYKDLPKDVLARYQEGVDRTYSEFVGLVAENRGMDEQAVRDTEALTYDGQDGVDIGLADAVGSIDTKLADLEAATTESLNMTTKKTAPAEATNDGQITQEQLDAAVETATAASFAEGTTAERERISAILGSEEAKARPAAAMAAAMDTDMTVEKATAFLAKLPEEKAEAPAAPQEEPKQEGAQPTPFGKQMDGSSQPNVGADAPDDSDPDSPAAQSASILTSFAAASGKTRKAS